MVTPKYELDAEETEEWRKALRANVRAWKMKHRSLSLEWRAKDRELRIAEKGELRDAKRKPTFTNQNGQKVVVDMADGRKNRVIQRLGEIEGEMEGLEISIEEAQAELDALPVPPPGEPETAEAE